MKRYLFPFILCFLIVGCGHEPPPTISVETAKSIALKQCPNCTVISIVKNPYGAHPEYIVSLTDSNYLHIVEVDLSDGHILIQSDEPLIPN
ncbi:MAG: hypothetical protein E7231_16340 [Cellulosilyticum sp.]|nr:hypothetical protein [Cellulosilyticum sp.]